MEEMTAAKVTVVLVRETMMPATLYGAEITVLDGRLRAMTAVRNLRNPRSTAYSF